MKNAVFALQEKLMYKYFSHFPRNRATITQEDWDTLIILDACRYDLFEEVNNLAGTLESRLSHGSYTGGFFEENFQGSKFHDTVYVTANPVPRVDKWCSVDLDSVFHAVVDVWKDHWDESVNTVQPAPVADAIKKAHADYPNKRILGHFIQPHQPFIGDSGLDIEEYGMRAYDELSGTGNSTGAKVWERLERGELSADLVWEAYKENLELVLPYVQDVCSEVSGKTVISSDHGNLFGEFAWPFLIRKYGHPPRIHTKNLIKVPWLEQDFETRRKITSDPPESDTGTMAEEKRLERLQHLGYR
jgi:hypothetical protein